MVHNKHIYKSNKNSLCRETEENGGRGSTWTSRHLWALNATLNTLYHLWLMSPGEKRLQPLVESWHSSFNGLEHLSWVRPDPIFRKKSQVKIGWFDLESKFYPHINKITNQTYSVGDSSCDIHYYGTIWEHLVVQELSEKASSQEILSYQFSWILNYQARISWYFNFFIKQSFK